MGKNNISGSLLDTQVNKYESALKRELTREEHWALVQKVNDGHQCSNEDWEEVSSILEKLNAEYAETPEGKELAEMHRKHSENITSLKMK